MIDEYPRKAVDLLIRADLPGPLWNGGNYAGYLIWRLSPERYKVFTDNRYDIYGGLVIREEHMALDGVTAEQIEQARLEHGDEAVQGVRTWDQILDHWNVETLFVPVAAKVNLHLAEGGWERVWEDFRFNIWVRDTPENRAAIDKARSLTKPKPWLARLR